MRFIGVVGIWSRDITLVYHVLEKKIISLSEKVNLPPFKTKRTERFTDRQTVMTLSSAVPIIPRPDTKNRHPVTLLSSTGLVCALLPHSSR